MTGRCPSTRPPPPSRCPAPPPDNSRRRPLPEPSARASRDATSSIDGSNITFEAANPLPPRSGLTIDVYIPKGILKQPSWFTRYVVWFIGGNPGALLPVWAFVVMFGLWWWKGRDPDPGISVAPDV